MHKILLIILLSLNPLYGAITLHSDLNQERHALPGEKYSGLLEIGNDSPLPQPVRIQKYDFVATADGESQYLSPGRRIRSNASWIDFSPELLTLPPHSHAIVTYEIEVPEADSLDGSYYSVLMIEPDSSLDPAQQENSIRIHSKIRYAVKIVTTIHSGVKQLLFTTSHLECTPGGNQLLVGVENKGTAFCRAALCLQLFDSTGTAASRLETLPQSLCPQSARRYTIPLADSLAGHFKALLTADCGGDALFGISFDLEVAPRPGVRVPLLAGHSSKEP